jgi:hypothetical protein
MSDKKFVPLAVYASDQPAAKESTTGGWVRGVYPSALEYTTSAKSLRGVVFLIGGVGCALGAGFMCTLLAAGMLHALNNEPRWTDFVVSAPGFLAFVAASLWALRFFSRMEFFLPIDLPIVFDRQRRKVYRLTEDLDEHGKPKQRGRGVVIEHDWDDIVAEHHVSTTTTGSSAQRHHTLVLMVRDKNPGDFKGPITPTNLPPYVDGFGLGDAKVLSEFSTPRVWEHVRRYMNENGPALPPGEQLADTSVPVTWWDSLGAVSVFGPGYAKRWHDSPILMVFMHLLSPLMFPLAILMATTHWASYKTAYPVQWPQEVLDKIGLPVQSQSTELRGAVEAAQRALEATRR